MAICPLIQTNSKTMKYENIAAELLLTSMPVLQCIQWHCVSEIKSLKKVK